MYVFTLLALWPNCSYYIVISDMTFENNGSLCPMESALMLLESLHGTSDVSQKDLKNICFLVKEMVCEHNDL